MRLTIFLLLIVLTLGVAACGDDDSSPSAGDSTRAEPSGSGSPDAGGESSSEGGGQEGAQGAEGGGGSASQEEQKGGSRPSADPDDVRESLRRLLRRAHRGDEFKGDSRKVYYEARSRCLAIPVRALARSHDAGSDVPEDVARAYAERQAPTGEGRRAAIAGCLDGMVSRLRRGI